MKITLPIEKLREFIDRAKFVITDKNDVMNIFNSVKIDIEWGVCTITKSNHKMFCQLSFPVKSDDISLILGHGNLELFCSTSDRELCIITRPRSGKVMLSDGKYKLTINDSEYKSDDFPSHTPPTGSGSRIEPSIIKWLKIAKNYIAKDQLRPGFCGVYLRDYEMFSSNGEIIFYHTFGTRLPTIALTEQEANIVCSLPFAEYSDSESWNIYRCESLVYGFRKIDGLIPFDIKRLTESVQREKYTVVQRKDILNFCNSSIKFNKSDVSPMASSVSSPTGIGDSGELVMSFEDIERGEEGNVLTTECRVIGEGLEAVFPPQVWKSIMDTLPYDEICLGETPNFIGVWSNEDANYLGMIGRYQKIVNERQLQKEAGYA